MAAHQEVKMQTAAWLLPALALLAACTGSAPRERDTTDRDRYLEHAGEPLNNFSYFGRIHGWRPLSRNQLVVWARANEPYLLTVAPGCLRLDSASQIALTSRMGNWVTIHTDEVRVGGDSCRITEIRKIDEHKMKAEAPEG
jgi:hypothetical protein